MGVLISCTLVILTRYDNQRVCSTYLLALLHALSVQMYATP